MGTAIEVNNDEHSTNVWQSLSKLLHGEETLELRKWKKMDEKLMTKVVMEKETHWAS